jgi:propanol-preferring alcohol dehydrogenase
MRAMILEQPGPMSGQPLSLRDLPPPRPGPGEVVVDVAACGVCRTDLQLCEGDLGAHRLPVVPGHQIVGRVTAVGDGVAEREPGQRVGVTWLADACGDCRFCDSGRENLCESAQFTGWDRDGGYASHTVARADCTFPLPDGFDDLAAAPLLCGGVIGYRSLCVTGIEPGARLGLYGFGASATCVIQVARHWDCEVYVATRSEEDQERARRLGAAWTGSYDETPPRPLDAAITFAPVGSVVVQALKAVDRGGLVAINAIHLDRVPEFPYELLWRERSLKSVANVTRRDVREFLRLAAEIRVRTECELFPLEQANEALGRLADGRISGAAVLTV